MGLTSLGFKLGEIEALLRSDEADPRVDEGSPVPDLPVSRPGDLWRLGTDRLICGDATDAATVDRVLEDMRHHLMVTDQPYGVEYDPAWRNPIGAAKTRQVGKVMNDHRADWREAWALFPGDLAYVWHGALHANTVADCLIATGLAIPQPDHLGQGAACSLPRVLLLAA